MGNLKTGCHIFSALTSLLTYSNILSVWLWSPPTEKIAPEGDEGKEDSCHYIYLCKKRPDADKLAAENWPKVEEQLKKAEEEEKGAYDMDDGGDFDEAHLVGEDEGDGKPTAASGK